MTELRWRTITGPMAWCPRGSCAFVYHGDQDRSNRRAIRAARAHAEETGHDVIVERG